MQVLFFLLVLAMISCGQTRTADKPGQDNAIKISLRDSSPAKQKKDSAKPAASPLSEQVNEMLKAKGESKWHVLNDKEARWIRGQFDYFITPKRKASPDYPYIVKGDFNGDGLTDLAAMVTDNSKRNYQVVIFMDVNSGAGKMTCWKDDIIENAALSAFPKTIIEDTGGDNSRKIKMKGDGINVEYFEQASFVIYWTGHDFKRIQTGD